MTSRVQPRQTVQAATPNDAPWMADVWHIPRPTRVGQPDGSRGCCITGCDLPAGPVQGGTPRPTDVLCAGHHRRFIKATGVSLEEFVEKEARASKILRPRGANTRKPTFPALDFQTVHPEVAADVRYIIGAKFRRNRWSDSEHIHRIVSQLLDFSQRHRLTSLRHAQPEGLQLLARTDLAEGHRYRELVESFPSMLALLSQADRDPWDRDEWHAADLGIPLRDAGSSTIIHWRKVTCDWLRAGLQTLARHNLQAGVVAWGTLGSYVRGGSLFSQFLHEEHGPLAPEHLTRSVFLNFLGWVRSPDVPRADLHAVSALARYLVELRANDIVPQLPETTFLLHGENPISKERKPKPFPSDILAAIDAMLAEDPKLSRQVRLMLRLFRAIGPRASEALLLPRDCIRHTPERGYSIEYFMTKTGNWRRVPLPARLGEDLAKEAMSVEQRFGAECEWLFPYRGRSPRRARAVLGETNLPPWSYQTFTRTVWHAYLRNGITKSALTGEILTGAQVHRFRHSIATGLLNEGWSQYEVQLFLAHKSATMVTAYAEIHEDTLRAKYEEFVSRAVDVEGTRQKPSGGAAKVERLRDRMVRSTLPNGYCTLPEKQTCDFVPSPCLSCKPFFRTTPTFLPIHVKQRDEALAEMEVALSEGRERAVAAHKQVAERLTTIIGALEEQSEAGGGA